jgi:hypothetical protein
MNTVSVLWFPGQNLMIIDGEILVGQPDAKDLS